MRSSTFWFSIECQSMKYASTTIHQRYFLINSDGMRFIVEPGEINGIAHTEGFVDTRRGIGKDRGFLEFIFVFASADRVRYRYRAVLHPLRLWPLDCTVVHESRGAFKKETTIKAVVDTRYELPFQFSSGHVHRSAHKYNDLAFQLRCDERALSVRLTYYAGEVFQDPKHAYQSVDYQLEYAHLLWRRAPQYSDDDVMPEGESYVSITSVGTLDEPGVPEGLVPSPIIVER